MSIQLPPILDFNDQTNTGTLIDTRDGQSYPVVKIGKQIWLAENFRYLPSKDKGDLFDASCVYDNDNSYLEKGYGRLYDWNTAMSIAPEGWKLPSNEDHIELRDFIIKDNNLTVNEVSSYLKSIEGWNTLTSSKDVVNIDKYGFNVKPAGYYNNSYNKGFFSNEGEDASFWSDTTKKDADYWFLSDIMKEYNYYHVTNNESIWLSVRLIKDI